MFDDNFFYDGFTEEALNEFIEWSDSVNDLINRGNTELAERRRKRFYHEIESVKIKDIENAIKEAEESGDNEKKALLERVREEVQNARRKMYERKAPEIITNLLGVNESRYSYDEYEYEYWDEGEIEDLIFSEQAIDEIKIDRNNFQKIAYKTNTNTIELAIERAEEDGDIEKKEKLLSIKDKIDRLRGSATIYGYRYQPGKEHSVERKPDETVLSIIDRMFEKLNQESGAAYALMSYVYVYLTNASDKTDLLKRLETIDGKTEEYEEILKEAYGKGTYKDAMKEVITTAQKDHESGDELGMDKEIEMG